MQKIQIAIGLIDRNQAFSGKISQEPKILKMISFKAPKNFTVNYFNKK